MDRPKVRFKGFTDDWEKRKLGEVAEIYDGVHQTPEYQDKGIMFLSVENIATLKSQKYISEEAFEHDYKVYPQKGDILMTRIGDVGTTNVVETSEKLAFYVSLALLKPQTIDSYFLHNIMGAFEFQKGLRERTLLTAIPQKINKDEIGKIPFSITLNIDEQKKIGDYFKKLDHLITFHQRKCEQTKKLKKYMLQKMFPKDGQSVPEIRMAGFTDAWEQRKFGEIVEKYEDPVETPHDGYERLGIRSHAKGTFHSFVEAGEELETAKMHRVAAGNFIVNITFGWEHAVAITDENDAGKLVSHRFPQFKFNDGQIPEFYRYVIRDEKFKHHLWLSSPGGAGRNRVLKLSDMLEYEMKFPSVEEQKKIATYFTDLGHLITLHQRKCDELKNIKKFMLQNMFI